MNVSKLAATFTLITGTLITSGLVTALGAPAAQAEAVHSFVENRAKALSTEIATHQNKLDVWETQRRSILKRVNRQDGDPEIARQELDDLGPRPDGPLSPSVVVSEPTFEGLTKNLPHMRPALGIFTDEGGGFIGGYAMSKDHRLTTMSGLSRFWDGSPADRARAADGVSIYLGRRLSMHLMVQPIVADELLTDPRATGHGFLARCLIVSPQSAIGTRLRVGHDPQSDVDLASFECRIGNLLTRSLPLKEREGLRFDRCWAHSHEARR